MAAEPEYDVFVSYSHSDSEWVRDWLFPRLKKAGLKVCIDYLHFSPLDILVEAITKAITGSRYTLLVFSESYLGSEWTKFERLFSLHLTVSEENRAVPLLFQPCEIPKPYGMFVYSDFTREKDRERQIKTLVAWLKGQAPPDIETETAPVVRSRYRNVNVELSPSGPQQYVLRASCPQIERATTEVVAIDGDDLRVRATMIKSGGADRAACQDMGRRLYRTIFTPEVARLWNQAQETANIGDGKGVLRLRLRLGDRRLSELPWELLHDDNFFVLMAHQHPVVRYAADVSAATTRRANVLLVDTTSAADADVDEEIGTIQERIGKAGGAVRVLRKATLPDIQDALRAEKHDIVHLIGRGETGEGDGRLLLRNRRGGVQAVDAEMFGYLLRYSPVRLLVLNANDAGTGSLLGVGEGANRAGIPAVVAMQGSISPDAAREFSRQFYQVLSDGCPVEACVAEGRKAIMAVAGLDNPQWALPVLFNGTADPMLFRAEPAEYCFGVEVSAPVTPQTANAPPASSPAREAAVPLHNLGDGAERPLTGRDAVLDAVRAALAPEALNPVVLLSGPAGMGKTSIAAAIAREALVGAAFDTIVWISPQDPGVTRLDRPEHCVFGRISLRGLTTVVLRTMQNRQLLGLDVSARVREIAALLTYGRHLIVIDDLPPASHTAVRTFIEAMPRTVRFIVTASHRIGLAEHEIPIGPTGDEVPFVANAEAQRQKRLKSRAPDPLPASTADYLRAIIPTLPAHWKTVLAVCATLPFRAAEAIVQAATELDEKKFASALGGLLDMRLVHREGETNVVLSGALRSFFRDGGDDARAALPDVEQQCISAYLGFVRQKRAGLPADRFEPELGNLVWAVQRTYANGSFRDLKTFRMALDDILYRLAMWPLAIGLGELAYLAASRIADYEEMGWAALYPLGRVNYHSGNLGLAERWCATALALFEQQNNEGGIIAAKRYLGRVKQSQGEMARARTLFKDVLQRTSKLAHPKPGQLGLAQATLAGLEQAEGKIAEAEKLYRRALAYYEPEGQPESIGATLHAIGRLYVDRDPKVALEYFQRAQDVLKGMRWNTRNARLAYGIGMAYERQGRFDDAVEQFRKARDIFAEAGAGSELAQVDAALVRLTAMRAHEVRSAG